MMLGWVWVVEVRLGGCLRFWGADFVGGGGMVVIARWIEGIENGLGGRRRDGGIGVVVEWVVLVCKIGRLVDWAWVERRRSSR